MITLQAASNNVKTKLHTKNHRNTARRPTYLAVFDIT